MAALFLTACGQTQSPAKTPSKIQNGVLDLTDWDFERDGPVKLLGETEFYWQQLLQSGDFATAEPPQKTGFIEIPAPWNGYEVNGAPLSGDGYATYRLKILLNNPNEILAFKMPEFETAYTLYVNGKEISANGTVGKTAGAMLPEWLPDVADFTTEDNQVEVIFQTSNFYHRKGGAGQLIQLGTERQMRQIRERSLNFEQFLFGSILIMGLYHVGLFSLRRKDKSPLYFGLCCFLISLRILVSGEYYLNQLWPNISWELLIKLNYLSFYLVVPIFAMFIHSLFPQESAKRPLRITLFLGFVFSSIILFTSPRIFTHTIQTYQVIVLIASVYFIYVLILAAAHKRDGAIVFLLGFLVLLLTVINDILHNNQIILTAFIGPFGLFLFIFFQAFLLSHRFSRAFFRVETLSTELEQRVTERTGQLAISNEQLTRTNQDLQQEIIERLRVGSALVEAKEAALEAQHEAETASQAKSAFLANMSHELRTPLNAILGFAQLMAHSQTLPPEHQDNLSIISASGEHLLILINQVLDLSKIEAGETALNKVDFDLYRLLDNLEGMFRLRAEDKGLWLIFDRMPAVPRYIRTDEVKLRQVLINLLNNAIKFTEKGRVTLRVGSRKYEVGSRKYEVGSRKYEVGSRKESSVPLLLTPYSLLHFEVEDTGPGIAPEEMDKLFEAFTQTEIGRLAQEGTGLGLTISQKFVQLMGGEISVESAVGPGTIFKFDIQIEPVDPIENLKSKIQNRVVALEPGQPRYRILIVDDKPDNRKLLIKLLNPLGFELREAGNGQEAVEIWREWQPHLIWMDMRMPVMDGYEATKCIKSKIQNLSSSHLPSNEVKGLKSKSDLKGLKSKSDLKGLKSKSDLKGLKPVLSEGPVEPGRDVEVSKIETVIIALTVSAFEEEQAIVFSAGCDDFLRKPFRQADIFEMMSKHIGVRYVYEDLAVSNQQLAVNEKPEIESLKSEIGSLPSELLANLEQAAIRIDMEMIDSLIDEVRTHNATLADALTALVGDFKYDEILFLTQEVKGQGLT